MWIRQRQTVCAMWLAAPLRGALLGCSITWLGNVDWSKPSRWWFWVTAPPGFGTWSPNTFQRQCRLWISIMPKNTCGTWLTPSLDAAQQWEQLGPRTPVRSLNKGRVKRSSPRSRRCRPFHRNQGKPAVSLNGPWITLPPTPSACAILSSVLKGCTSAVASPRPLAKPSSARAPNAPACAGLLKASMPSCLCARRFSMTPMIHSGKRNMPLDCLQRIHTPSRGAILACMERMCYPTRAEGDIMETVRIYRLDHLPRVLAARLRDAQMEAARVWTMCRDLHQAARHHQLPWPTRDDLQKATKGRFALHSQTVQMICHAFLANVQTTRLVKPQHPQM